MNKWLLKYKQLSTTTKATIWFTFCNFLLKAISFITVPLFALLLSPDEYGKLNIFNAYQQIFLIFATFELSLGAYQRGILKYKDKIRNFTSSLLLLSSIITGVFFCIMMLTSSFIIKITNSSMVILILMSIYFLVEPAYGCWLSRKRFSYEYIPATVATILTTLLSTVGALLALIVLDRTSNIKIAATLIISIALYLPFYVKSINFNNLINDRNELIDHWKFCLAFQGPLIFHSLSYLVLSQADRIMIGWLVGNSEAAFYSVAYSLASVVVIFQASLNQVLKPWRYQKLEAKEYKVINTNTSRLVLSFAIIILGFILIAPEIMRLLFNPEYYEAVWSIPPVAMSVLFMFMYSVFADIESYFSKTKYIMYASIICAALNIVLNYFGIKIFGYIACGYTTLISYVVFALLHYYFLRRVCKQNDIDVSSVVSGKSILLIGTGSLILMIVFTFIYNNLILRIIILALIIGLIITFRNRVFKYFKCIRADL